MENLTQEQSKRRIKNKAVMIIYVTPDGVAVPCDVKTSNKVDGEKLVIPRPKGGYKYLKMLGFETIYQYRKSKLRSKHGEN